MTWNAFHNRGEVLRTVIATADARRDGILPMDVVGVTDTFADELSLLGALQLRWHARLTGRIERELMNEPMDLESAVITAWQGTADELPGIRAIIDHYRAEPTDDVMAAAMLKSAAKEHQMLAVMAGRSSSQDLAAARVGSMIETTARVASRPAPVQDEVRHLTILDRVKAVIAA